MNISTISVNSVTVVRFEGNIDTGTSTEAQESLEKLIDEGALKIVVNFSEVGFVSSAGLRILLVITKKLKNTGGNLRVCGLNETVKEIFEITGFDSIFNLFEGESEALEDF